MISSLSTEENIKFLKKEYGIGGASLAYSDAEISQWHDAKGIRLYKGYDDNRPEKLLNWNYVEKRIRELVLNDRYLNPKEFDEYLVWLERDTTEKINTIKEIPVEKVLDYHLGYKVNIFDEDGNLDFNNFLGNINDEITVEVKNGCIRVFQEVAEISECIIYHCYLVYGKLL